MKKSACFAAVILLALALALPALAADSDSMAAVFAFGRSGGWMASGFAVGDGSYIVVSSDALTDPSVPGGAPVLNTYVVSSWTGEAYPATVLATDKDNKIAVLKLPAPAVPGIQLASDKEIAKAPRFTLGQLRSGDEVGGQFKTMIFGMCYDRAAKKFAVQKWDATNACLTEDHGADWLFLSKVKPADKMPKAALVTKPGIGVIGVFLNRLIIDAGAKTNATFSTVLPAPALRPILVKAGIPADSLDKPATLADKATDAESAFQTFCTAFSNMTMGKDSTEAASAAIKIRPKNATAHMLYATALGNQGKYEEAIKEIDAAMGIDAAVPNGRLNKGIMLASAKKTAEAEAELRKAMQDAPKDYNPVIALSMLLSEKGNASEESIKLVKSAIKLSPNDLSLRITAARIMKHEKDYDEAIAIIQNVVQVAPNWGDARVALATTYEAAKKMDLAEAEYRKLVELEPKNPDSYLVLTEFLISTGKNSDAKQTIEKLRTLELSADVTEAVKKLEAKIAPDSTKTE